jgi:S1-C subfamily serine protease
LLAAGVVIVGAHLATAFTERPVTTDHVITTSEITMPPDASPNLGASLAAAVSRVGHSIAVIDTQSATGIREQSLGVVVNGDGAVLTALEAVEGATTVLVDLPGTGITSVGKVVGRDTATGLAVVMVRGESGISSMRFSSVDLDRASVAVALTSPAGAADDPTLSLGALSAVNVTASTDDDDTLMDADLSDMPSATNPLGSPLLDSNGDIEGIVTGSEHGYAVVTPGWIAGPVAAELTSGRPFAHGELGAEARTVVGSRHSTAGVEVTNVARDAGAVDAVLQKGDEILAVNGSRVLTLCQLEAQLYVRSAGSKVSLELSNGRHRWSAKLTLAA